MIIQAGEDKTSPVNYIKEKVKGLKTVELLAPVGKIENAYAAIENGADAIFVGGKCFNARQYADNFTNDELEAIVRYSKLRAVKVYITVNTLIKQQEIHELFDYLIYLDNLGIDAIISQDLGVVSLVKKYFPQIALHASTQMTAHSVHDVLFLKSLGFKRVVLARELSLKEIKEIIEICSIEIETFIHGALCYSYSGQCLMSSLIGGRSGNRGRCAQPCRMKYNLTENGHMMNSDEYLISLKDMCSIEFLPDLIQCGIHSFKIEGRMKSPEYVASVVKTYRKYIDLIESQSSYKVDLNDIEEVKGVFNRGGFSKGYYFDGDLNHMITPTSPRHMGVKIGTVTQFSPKLKRATILLDGELNPGDGIEIIRKGRESVGTGISKHYEKGLSIQLEFDKYIDAGSEVFLTKNHQLLKQLRNTYLKANRKIPIDLKIVSEVGQPIYIEAAYKTLSVQYKGEILEGASNAPITKENAIRQLTKFGNTSFIPGKIDVKWDETGYIPISKLNEIRRKVLEMMEEKILERSIKKKQDYISPQNHVADQAKTWSAYVTTLEQLEVCINNPQIETIYWDWNYNNEMSLQANELCSKRHKKFYLALPYIMKNKTYKKFAEDLSFWDRTSIDGYLIRNYGQFNLLKSSLKNKNIDYNLNIMNNEAIHLWDAAGAAKLTVSVETTYTELQCMQGNLERIVYGYIPVMTSEQCLLKDHHKCTRMGGEQKVFKLVDRKEAVWGIQTDCEACVMQLLTEKPLVVKHLDELNNKGIKSLRLNFTHESKEETQNVLEAYLAEDMSQIKLIKGVSFKSIE
ncbi:MAG: peptidase [Clostridia bacterium]|jgi:putative protease|nr:peptidase [Clostridia bacterium]